MPKISVVLAVYNTERYIEKCAVSLFEQTLDDMEYIFVDDCSTDNSIAVLEQVIRRYPNRANQVRIIRNHQNRKVAYTRTIGMKAATGDYIIHCDPDDFVDMEAYEIMYETAISTGSDIVGCTLSKEDEGNRTIAMNEYYSTVPKECIKHIYEKYFFPSLCTHLIKRSLYVDNNIYPYPDINTGEDLNVLLRVFHYAKKVTYIPKPNYHYIMRGSSLTHNPNVMALWNHNISKNLKQIIKFFEATGDNEYRTMLNYLKFTKKQFLLGAKPPQLKMWYNTYPECREDIFKFSHLSMSRKIMYWCFAHCYGALWCYYKVKRNQ